MFSNKYSSNRKPAATCNPHEALMGNMVSYTFCIYAYDNIKKPKNVFYSRQIESSPKAKQTFYCQPDGQGGVWAGL